MFLAGDHIHPNVAPRMLFTPVSPTKEFKPQSAMAAMTRSHSAKATAIGTMRMSPTDDDETAAPTDGAANFLQELATDSPPSPRVNGGGKVGHVGGSIVGFQRTSTTQWYVLPPPLTRHTPTIRHTLAITKNAPSIPSEYL